MSPVSVPTRIRLDNSGGTISPAIECQFNNSGNLVETTRAELPPIGGGQRVGAAWLAHACGHCFYCDEGRENLCDHGEFNGSTRDGGFATHMVAEAAFLFPLPDDADPIATAPLLCAGLIGWRCLKAAGSARR